VGYREMKRRLRGGFEHATLADLSPEDKNMFVDRWCEVTVSELSRRLAEADKLKQAVHGRHGADRIERLTGNPMLLTTLALVQRKVGKLPSKRHKLYWEAVGVLLNWRSEVDEPLDPDEALPQLQYVAYAMCDRGVQQLRRDELLELLEGVRRDYPHIRPVQRQTPEAFLAQLERRTGLLVETGYQQHDGKPVPVYEFRHLTFQEYLAALALVEGRYPGHNRDSTLAERVGPLAGRCVEVETDPNTRAPGLEWQVAENWREPLRLCVACCNDDDVDAAIKAILQPTEASNVPRNGSPDRATHARPRAILAALCLADEPNVSQPTAEAVLRNFIAHAGPYDGSGHARTGFDRAVLEVAASSWAAQLQMSLVHEFQWRGLENRRGPGGLLGMVSDVDRPDDESGLARWMTHQVMQVTSGSVESAIIAAMAVMSAAFNGKARVVPGLIDALITFLPRGPVAAYAASWALGWLSNSAPGRDAIWRPSAAEFSRLLPFLTDSATDPEALTWLAWISRCIQSSEAIAPQLELLAHPHSSTREAAADALGEIGDDRAVDALRPHLTDPVADVRRCTLKALVQIRGDDVAKKLLLQWHDANSPFIDPQEPINASHVSKAAKELKLPETEIRRRYEGLAAEYGLTLALPPAAGTDSSPRLTKPSEDITEPPPRKRKKRRR
jgi:hypothetical protein